MKIRRKGKRGGLKCGAGNWQLFNCCGRIFAISAMRCITAAVSLFMDGAMIHSRRGIDCLFISVVISSR